MGLLAGGFFTSGEGGDVINLQSAQGNDDTSGGPASAGITAYGSNHGSRFGEVWGDEDGTNTYAFDLLTPKSNVDLYEMKWDARTGSPPTTSSSAEGVWQPLTTAFTVSWSLASGPDEISGDITVSIRKGSGPSVLQTAIWDGEVILSGKGK